MKMPRTNLVADGFVIYEGQQNGNTLQEPPSWSSQGASYTSAHTHVDAFLGAGLEQIT